VRTALYGARDDARVLHTSKNPGQFIFERSVLVSVLRQAWIDLGDPLLGPDVREWVGEGGRSLGGFRWYCWQLNLEPDQVARRFGVALNGRS